MTDKNTAAPAFDPNDPSSTVWEAMFAQGVPAPGVRAELIEGLKSLLEGRGVPFRGDFAEEAYGDAADAIMARIPALSRRPAAAAEVAATAVPWDRFPGWLIDHREGEEITEEGLQRALGDMLKHLESTGEWVRPAEQDEDAEVAAGLDAVGMVMSAAARAQQRLAQESAKPSGNMLAEYPPAAEQPAAEPELLPLLQRVQGGDRYHEIARRLKAAIENKWDEVFQIEMAELIAYIGHIARAHLSAAGQGKDSERLDAVRAAVTGYYEALDARQHGGVAQGKAFNKIEQALGMSWNDHRAMKAGAQGGA